MKPPWLSTMDSVVDRPRPVPRPRPFVLKNGSNMRSRTSGEIPEPVSATLMRTYGPGRALGWLRGPLVEAHVLGRERQRAPLRHGVARVDAEVHQHLLQGRGLSGDDPQAVGDVRADGDRLGERLVGDLLHLADEVPGLQGNALA